MLKNIDLYLLIGGGLIVSRLVDGAFCILSLDVFVSSCSLPEDICADGSVSITTYYKSEAVDITFTQTIDDKHLKLNS